MIARVESILRFKDDPPRRRAGRIMIAEKTMRMPVGACDCHMHIYDGRFPSVADARLTPPEATVEDYRALQRRLRLERVVVVTPSTYGNDNSCTLDALSKFGPVARGIAVVDPAITDAELLRLHDHGIRGIRFNQMMNVVTPLTALETLAARIAPLGWHVQLLLRADDLAAAESRLRALPVPVVFDHLGRLPVPGSTHPGYGVIRRLLDAGRAWVKLSGAYLACDYEDADALARLYVAAAPERMVWGSNWPHPTATAGFHEMPDDLDLLRRLGRSVGNEPMLERVLVDNPAALYGFANPDKGN